RDYATTPPPPSPDCAGSDAPNEAADAASEATTGWALSEMRLVLKGWRWLSAADLLPEQAEPNEALHKQQGQDPRQDESQRAADDAARMRKAALAAYLQHLNAMADLAKDLYTSNTGVDEGATHSPDRLGHHDDELLGAHGPETHASANEPDLD